MDWVPEGVTVVNNRGVHAAKGGEFALMGVLMLHNHMPAIIGNQRGARWASLYSTPIEGRTVVIVGVGNIGGAAARQCKRAGMRVLGVCRHGRACEGVDVMYSADAIDKALPKADFLLMAAPLTPETRKLLDRRRQSLMKPGSSVINMGRAGTMDYDALADNLRNGHIGGAILDVFDPEPLPAESPLWSTPNLIVTPHVSADDGDAYVPITLELIFENLRRHLENEPLMNVVRPDLGY
jgi:phosphoglycerate dehydrogenase-like enzyme